MTFTACVRAGSSPATMAEPEDEYELFLNAALQQLSETEVPFKSGGVPHTPLPAAASLEELSERSSQLIANDSWEEALNVVSQEHELVSALYGDTDERTLSVLGKYAGVLWNLDRGADAKELLEELVDKHSRIASAAADGDGAEEARSQLADVLSELSTVLMELDSPANGAHGTSIALC